jgi:quercetin dioxygenase-like cupin family protein
MPVFPANDEGFWQVDAPPTDAAPWFHTMTEGRIGAEKVGWRSAAFPMGKPSDEDVPIVALLYIPPGEVLPRHTHDCYRVEVMLQGSLEMGDRVLRPGDVWSSEAGEFYGPHTAGPTGSLSVEIFASSVGQKSRTPDGERVDLSKERE